MNLNHIFTGWAKKWGWLPTTEAEAELSRLRLSICQACPLSKTSPVLKFLANDEAEYVDELYCTKCTCPCSAKSLVVREHCPIKNW